MFDMLVLMNVIYFYFLAFSSSSMYIRTYQIHSWGHFSFFFFLWCWWEQQQVLVSFAHYIYSMCLHIFYYSCTNFCLHKYIYILFIFGLFFKSLPFLFDLFFSLFVVIDIRMCFYLLVSYSWSCAFFFACYLQQKKNQKEKERQTSTDNKWIDVCVMITFE